jgi:hypothetical protein
MLHNGRQVKFTLINLHGFNFTKPILLLNLGEMPTKETEGVKASASFHLYQILFKRYY